MPGAEDRRGVWCASRLRDDTWIDAPQPPRRAPLFGLALAAALGAAVAVGWLGATLLNPPLVLTGAVHLMGCDP